MVEGSGIRTASQCLGDDLMTSTAKESRNRHGLLLPLGIAQLNPLSLSPHYQDRCMLYDTDV